MPQEVFSADDRRDCGKWTGGGTEVSKWRFAFSGKMDKRKCVICDENVTVQSEDASRRIFDVKVVMNL